MRTLAVIAHDNRKAELVAWATFNRELLNRLQLHATRHTARLLQDKVGLPVEWLLSGSEGGDAQIAALAAAGQVDAVLFLVDPLHAQAHEPDFRTVIRVCNVRNLPIATNLATADLMLATLTADPRRRGAASWAMPD
jgi:methylglyoxal synthase